MKTLIFSFLLAIIAQVALATPPACLLHAVNTQDEPSNLSSVCGSGALKVQSYMASNCGNFQNDAQKAFIATCSSAGTSVAAYTATGTSATGTITSARSSGTSTGSAGSTKSTAGANVHYRDSMGPMAAAAVALVGAVAAL